MNKLVIVILFVPGLALAQLREFSVTEMTRPETNVVQANTEFPDNAVVFIYSLMDNLTFRSSMSAISKQTYNRRANRYEVLVVPVRQILFVAAYGFMEKDLGTINPKPKETIYFKVEEKLGETLAGKGSTTIESEPTGASILINEIETVYKTPYLKDIPSGVTRITLRKEFYLDFDTIIRIKPDEKLKLKIRMTPSWADLKVKALPKEAVIYLNGEKRGQGELELSGIQNGLRPGNYELKIVLDNHRAFTRYLQVRGGQKYDINATLEPIMGKIMVKTEPPGASVLLDDQRMGVTPLERAVITGSHQVTLEKQGYGTVMKQVTVKEGITAMLNETLTTGMSVTLTSEPTGVPLFIDGNSVGVTPQRLNLKYGVHTIKLANNTKIVEGKLEVIQNGRPDFYYDVREDAIIRIEGKPSHAKVFLNGEFKGYSPIEVKTKIGFNNIKVSKSYKLHIDSRKYYVDLETSIMATRDYTFNYNLVESSVPNERRSNFLYVAMTVVLGTGFVFMIIGAGGD